MARSTFFTARLTRNFRNRAFDLVPELDFPYELGAGTLLPALALVTWLFGNRLYPIEGSGCWKREYLIASETLAKR
jgi:hypothetical protein